MQLRQKDTTAYPLIFRLIDEDSAALEDATPTITLRKPAGSFVAAGGTVTELENGLYQYAWAAGELDTLGELLVRITASEAQAIVGAVRVVSYDPFDTIHRADNRDGNQIITAGTGTGQVSVDGGRVKSDLVYAGGEQLNVALLVGGQGQLQVRTFDMQAGAIINASLADNTITASKIADNAITSGKIASGALTAAKFAAGAFDAVWTVTTRTLTSFGTLVADVAAAILSNAANKLLTDASGHVRADDRSGNPIMPTSHIAATGGTVDNVTNTANVTNAVTTDAASRTASQADLSDVALEATAGDAKTAAEAVNTKLTTARAEKLDRDIAHAGDADTYKADVSGLVPLTGARTITITVEDEDENPVEGARVRLSRVGETGLQQTDSDGQTVFNVDDATWTVAITASGLTFAGASLEVTEDDAVTYTMDTVAITPPDDPTKSTGVLLTEQSGWLVQWRMIATPAGDTGQAYDGRTQETTSGGDRLAELVGLVRGAEYEVRVGPVGRVAVFTVPDEDTFEVNSIIRRK